MVDRTSRTIRVLATLALAGFLASGSCHARYCSGDCDDHRHDPHAAAGVRDRIRGYELTILGTPPIFVTRLVSAVRGPWLSPAERADPGERAFFAERVLAANGALLGLGEPLEIAVDESADGRDLLLHCRATDTLGRCDVTLRVDPAGRLSEVVVRRPEP